MSWARGFMVALGAVSVLAGCTNDGSSAFERLRPQIEATVLGGDEAPPQATAPIDRAALNAIPFATIAVSAPGQDRAFVAAVANNDGFVVYQDTIRRSVVLEGGLLVGTHGLGFNLSAIKHQTDDPVAVATPLARWPSRVTRNYQFALVGQDGFDITVVCQHQQVAAERIEIVELFYDVVRVEETCGNGARVFSNIYWVDPGTGFIWKSQQWIGPRQPDPLIVEIIRPIA